MTSRGTGTRPGRRVPFVASALAVACAAGPVSAATFTVTRIVDSATTTPGGTQTSGHFRVAFAGGNPWVEIDRGP